jgi:NADH dehydrogenase
MIFIAGSTGFIGKHLLKALTEKNYKIRCLIRKPKQARTYEKQGIEAIIGDITQRDTLYGILTGVRMVVHLVGIIEEKGNQTFKKVHVEGTKNLVEEAKKAGVEHFFYQSALGASLDSPAAYHRTKAEAEEIVRASGIPFTIFRPSLIVGKGDGFTKKILELIKFPSPVIPVPGKGKALFQPIYIGDWVECFLRIIENPNARDKIYELGGPEQLSYNEIVKLIAEASGVRKPLFHIPMGLANIGVRLLEKTPLSPVTSEQLMLLNEDNICDKQSVRKNFGFKPLPFKEALSLFISRQAQDS